MVPVRPDGGDGGRYERGLQPCLEGACVRSRDRIQALHRLLQFHAAFHLPAHPVQVDHLSRANPGREIREEETVAWGGLDA
jgi:hypothetical protein